jgi:MFS family permease
MISADGREASGTLAPPLLPALAAMTGLQALVALALFAPGVLGPQLGYGEGAISLFATACFAVGAATSLYGGMLAARLGSFTVAALCGLAVAVAMAVASLGTLAALLLSGLIVGLAFGPETPASSTLLAKLARPGQRPLIFSVRQTGNQIGAMLGSLTLPAIALVAPRAGFAVIVGLALVAAAVFLGLRARYDTFARGPVQRLDWPAAVRLVRSEPALARLALASMPYSAMQLALNAYFVTFAIERLRLPYVAAGLLLAVAQAGGLLGRLGWGWVATRLATTHGVIVGLGLAMALLAILVSCMGPGWPLSVVVATAFAFGLTASGWNGVFLAEVARLAPEGRVAEATGAVLTASYGGLLLGPLLVAAVAGWASLSASYAVLGVVALAATLPLLRR